MKILVIEDNPGDVRLVQEMLRQPGGRYTVDALETLGAGIEFLLSQNVDTVLLDMNLPDSHGLETLTRLQTRVPHLPIVIMTSTDDEELAAKAVRLGAQDYLVKGQVDSELLRHAITYAVERKKAEEEVARLLQKEQLLTEELQVSNEELRQREEQLLELNRNLQQSEKKYRSLFENMTEGFALMEVISDDSGKACDLRYLEVNEASARLLGHLRKQLIGHTFREISPGQSPSWLEEYGRVSSTGQQEHWESYSSVINKWVEIYAFSPMKGYVARLMTDITERKRLEERLVVQERLAIMGKLSGNIAHEIRNLLATVDSSAQYLQMTLKDSNDKTTGHLDRMHRSIHRASSIIEELLELSRLKEPKLAPVGLSKVVSSVTSDGAVPDTVKLVIIKSDDEVTVMADEEQLNLVIQNIVKNAVEAMKGQGTLTVTVSQSENEARISITDTGPGIKPEVMARLFEPLFTTKESGHGFGLSTAKAIVERHNGKIDVSSELGEGTTFTVKLPLPEK